MRHRETLDSDGHWDTTESESSTDENLEGWLEYGKKFNDNQDEEPRLKSIELGPEGDNSIILILT